MSEHAHIGAQAAPQATAQPSSLDLQDLLSMMDQAPVALCAIDKDGLILWANAPFVSWVGRSQQDLRGQHCATVHSSSEVGEICSALRKETLLRGQQQSRRVVLQVDEGERAWELRCAPINGEDGSDLILFAATDATAHQETEKALRQRAFYDRLTGLPNRDLFLDRLAHAVHTASRRDAEPFAVLFMDLDSFKDVNDTQGHSVGDMLLAQVAERLQTCVRPGDTVARLGGDEFAVLLPTARTARQARTVARRIHEALQSPFVLQDKTRNVSTSIGIAIYDGSQSSDDVLRDADVAMYLAKRAGAGQTRLFTERMRAEVERTVRLKTELRLALDEGALKVFYQPTISLSTGELESLEALVRWSHPTRGLLHPGEFLPIASKSGLMPQLQLHVVKVATQQMQDWLAEGLLPPQTRLSLNLSAERLTDPEFVELLCRTIAQSQLPPSRLWLELDEATLIDLESSAAETLPALGYVASGLIVDSYGAGPCSLKLLYGGLIKAVKLTRECLPNDETPATTAPIFRAAIEASQHGGPSVCALGIESRAQLEQLRAAGCLYGQGFLFARALPACELDKRLRGGQSWLIPEAPSL